MSKFIKTIAAASLACGLTFAANADNSTTITVNDRAIRTVAVSYDDLNLDSAAGRETLETRIRAAVKQVCGHTNGRQTIKEMTDYQTCVAQASQTALAGLDPKARARFAMKF